jgi:hypothetical protein
LSSSFAYGPLRKQNDPLDVQPNGQDPRGGFGIASEAPCVGAPIG